MTLSDVFARIEAIRKIQHDLETAHNMERKLHIDVLRAIAEGKAQSPKALANAAVSTIHMDFVRWFS